MIYMNVNGLLVEAESVVEFQIKAEFNRKGVIYRRELASSTSDDDTITQIVREVLKQIKK